MNPFGFMSPFGLDDQERLRGARERAEMLRREWQAANGMGRRNTGPNALAQSRMRVGRALIKLGRRLLPAESPSPRITVGATRRDVPC